MLRLRCAPQNSFDNVLHCTSMTTGNLSVSAEMHTHLLTLLPLSYAQLLQLCSCGLVCLMQLSAA